MAQPGRRLLYWAPRVLGVLFVLFSSIFALDVFQAGYSAGQTVVALLIHLIPTGLLAIALAIAWRWEWIGAVIFTGLGLVYVAMTLGASGVVFPVLLGPLFLLGALFLAAWLWGRPRQAT